jgi:hypothetical protein
MKDTAYMKATIYSTADYNNGTRLHRPVLDRS